MATEKTRAGTLPAGGGSSMPAGTQVKKVQVGSQKRPQPPTKTADVPPMHLPAPGK